MGKLCHCAFRVSASGAEEPPMIIDAVAHWIKKKILDDNPKALYGL
jgi:hypothetical protein